VKQARPLHNMPTKAMVTRLTRNPIDGINIDGKRLEFGARSNSFEVSDPGMAEAIEAQHGPKATGEVVVARHQTRDPGHRYFFGSMPEMPWKRKDKPQ
jgi:hypothetical protein